ncbi:hypothetical protein QAD02_015264 [Eretmocerus hayati]|uniref:Uncharacterized protein n=1 Tax=Eretmocerus hayati TaxID=131215 RepID=A0ACC2P867_9HYME|nr:hypothetical protein QAD02_015264 [Eretmocerus hayati]
MKVSPCDKCEGATLELYLPYAPLQPGGSGPPGCRPVLLGGVDLSMSAASGPAGLLGLSQQPPQQQPVPLEPRGPSPVQPVDAAPSCAAVQQRQQSQPEPGVPNPDVLLALLARNKKLEGKS